MIHPPRPLLKTKHADTEPNVRYCFVQECLFYEPEEDPIYVITVGNSGEYYCSDVCLPSRCDKDDEMCAFYSVLCVIGAPCPAIAYCIGVV